MTIAQGTTGLLLSGGVASAGGSAIYTVPIGEIATVISFWLCNEDAAQDVIASVAVLPAGVTTPSSGHYIIKNKTIGPEETVASPIPLTLGPGESFYVGESGGNVSCGFSLSGTSRRG